MIFNTPKTPPKRGLFDWENIWNCMLHLPSVGGRQQETCD